MPAEPEPGSPAVASDGTRPDALDHIIDVDVASPEWAQAQPEGELRRIVERAVLAVLDRRVAGPAEVGVVLASDQAVRTLNHSHRGKDRATNVLAFPIPEAAGRDVTPRPLGDVVLAFGVVTDEAAAAGLPFAHHLAHLVVHGCLHLLGHDHEDDADADRMEAAEVAILAGLGVDDPYRSVPDGAVRSETAS